MGANDVREMLDSCRELCVEQDGLIVALSRELKELDRQYVAAIQVMAAIVIQSGGQLTLHGNALEQVDPRDVLHAANNIDGSVTFTVTRKPTKEKKA